MYGGVNSTTAALLQIETLYYKKKFWQGAFVLNTNNTAVPSDIEDEKRIGAKNGQCEML